MSYQFVVNPNQAQYVVDGHHKARPVEDVVTSSPSVAKSLLPEISDENGHSSLQNTSETGGNAPSSNWVGPCIDEAAHFNEQIPRSSLVEPSENNQDALDKSIQEARAIKDLVRSNFLEP